MNAAGRLSVYGVGLAVVFAAAFAVGGAVVPDDAGATWSQSATPGTHSEAADAATPGKDEQVSGLSLARSDFALGPVHAPTRAGVAGELSFQVRDAKGDQVSDFVASHERALHLMVVRSDGAGYQHVHPELDADTGTWSLPWRWDAAGTYRVFVDFVPADGADAHAVTLSRAVEVGGTFSPETVAGVSASDSVGGFDLRVTGDLVAGESSELAVAVSRDGRPVTNLQPYLGAFGHLVALRDGDLAYLHVHAEGSEPAAGETSGPTITFMTQAPTPGFYLLYLDFQVDGQVHTARFVLEAAPGDGSGEAQHGETHEHGGH
ncbi:heavy metal-binding domain-containing protein [Mycolicibacterium wolinskyi]|uniref:Heavy metal-binding domain-containing protein n=1 Tax=Mycolicibacterium wolinskyi TaxID=59750 RepID=A0A132PEU4_9MYCO|nr:heavy metal-binding domain-containing protein [Mycolicibacterium wolinskyi]KWX20512.1 heavy metal-binding domain-containing protein [Mycolicibacterium wolinskyi]